MEITRAHVRRTLNIDGRLCGEVEVHTNDPQSPELLIYFAAAPGGGFEAVRIVENDARTEIDWYENPLHQAFTDRTEDFGGGNQGGRGYAGLADQVLAYGSVKDELARGLER